MSLKGPMLHKNISNTCPSTTTINNVAYNSYSTTTTNNNFVGTAQSRAENLNQGLAYALGNFLNGSSPQRKKRNGHAQRRYRNNDAKVKPLKSTNPKESEQNPEDKIEALEAGIAEKFNSLSITKTVDSTSRPEHIFLENCFTPAPNSFFRIPQWLFSLIPNIALDSYNAALSNCLADPDSTSKKLHEIMYAKYGNQLLDNDFYENEMMRIALIAIQEGLNNQRPEPLALFIKYGINFSLETLLDTPCLGYFVAKGLLRTEESLDFYDFHELTSSSKENIFELCYANILHFKTLGKMLSIQEQEYIIDLLTSLNIRELSPKEQKFALKSYEAILLQIKQSGLIFTDYIANVLYSRYNEGIDWSANTREYFPDLESMLKLQKAQGFFCGDNYKLTAVLVSLGAYNDNYSEEQSDYFLTKDKPWCKLWQQREQFKQNPDCTDYSDLAEGFDDEPNNKYRP